MAERVSQQKIREESVWKDQMRREEEMADAEEQVEEVPRIPDFQEEGDTQQDLGGKEKNALRSPSEEAQNAKHKGVDQQVKPGGNIYYVELASDEDEEKGTEAQTDWETRLAKKLKFKLNLKRKRETKQIPMLTYREEQEDQEDREPKKTKNSFNTKGTGEYKLVKHGSGQIIGIQMAEEAGVFVYGNPVFQKRRRLWQELTVSNRSREEPQAFLGDFNDILNQDEKVGFHPQPRTYLNNFRRFVDENRLMDIDLKGSRYTWYSNPRNNFVTRERLDRVLVNWKWLNIHQNVILRVALAISSDHCALILETQPRDRIKKEFKFEAFWTEYEECEEVVRRSWEQDVGNRNCWSQFTRNRSRCIRELTENDGQYSVRSGYQAAKEEKDTREETMLGKASTSQNLKEIWERIWRLPVPKKVRMFLWKVVHEILPVNAKLHQRKSAPTPMCSICQEQEETIEYMLLLCPWTRAVWFGSSLQIVPTAFNVGSFEKWLMSTIDKIKSVAGNEQDKVLCNLRCNRLQQNTLLQQKDLNRDNKAIAGRNGDSKRIIWRPPLRNKVKVNIDAAFHREIGIAASAAVIRDWQGKIITGITSKFKAISVLAVEAQAYREAIILTKNLQIRNCIIELDCLPLVQAIKARMPLAEPDAIIRDILLMLEEAPDVGATWTPREGNILAHQLAVMAARNQLQRQWLVSLPVQVRNIIKKEARFANLQNNHRNQTQDNQVSVSTNLQEGQSDEGLPGRVEAETWNNHASQGKRRLQPTTSHRPMKDSSRDTSNIRKMLSGGDEARFLSG
ncbi:hypothetical protein Ahy_B07g088524 [Arachis hypogaea]|uniref:RNase H type-1 domain-containing protein n=1 Tax=Arachis hypogaea TaxID=3818 RepID=A0A444YEQ5_ARAHY|nr:hypothetical protein Ahy_B07g088524 [Arachis hypogaea]